MDKTDKREENFENENIILDEDLCDTCKNKIYYSVVHDAYFCISCDKWLESACEDPECRFCSDRPDKPSDLR